MPNVQAAWILTIQCYHCRASSFSDEANESSPQPELTSAPSVAAESQKEPHLFGDLKQMHPSDGHNLR